MSSHRRCRMFLSILVIIALAGGMLAVPARAASKPSVTVTPSSTVAGAANVSYTFTFSLPGGLTAAQYLTVTFPPGYDVSHVTQSTVTCYGGQGWSGSLDACSVSGQNVGISLTTGFATGEPVTLTFLPTAQIANPAVPSTYTFSVSTSLDSGSGSVAITSGGTGGGGTTGSGVTSVSATANPGNAGKVAEFTVSFVVGTDYPLVGGTGDYVDIRFPAGSTIPATIPTDSILLNVAAVTSIQVVNGTTLRLGIPSNRFIMGGVSCTVMVLTAAGVTHPELPGTYTISVGTSKQPNLIPSNAYLVVGTSVVNAGLSVEPARQGMAAQVQVTMTTSPSGALTAREGRIYVELPAGMTIPAGILASTVRVNDVAAAGVQMVSATRMAVTVPQAIGPAAVVRLVIGIDAGLRNPTTVGSYQVGVSTSADTAPVALSYTVTSSQIGMPAVQVSTGAAGVAAAYTITFTTGPGGALAAGIDRINIEFPAGTTIPSAILSGSVTVGGTPSTLVTSAGMVVSVTAPAAVGAGAQVVLVITEGAGVRNPVTGGSYTLRISTSRETTAVVSTTYAVSALPTVRAAIDPAAPDGYHGYYRTRPAITLTAQSAVDPQPVISYHFDDNADSVYGGQPLIAPEGTHTLTYYAVDRLGNRSESGAMTVAVDSIAPVVALTQPTDGQVLSSPSLTVQGTVDVGSTVQVNGHNAPVDATGVFVYAMTVQGSPATIVIDATDPAGNTAHRSVTVTLDTTPPSLTLTQPLNFQKFQRFPIVVAGRTEAGASVTVQGTPADVRTDGTFEYAITSAPDGALTITVVARDAAGNQVTRTVVVTVQSTKLIQMQVGTLEALVNGQVVALQTAPLIRNSTTLVPLRFVAETFGITPVWDGVFQIIDLPVGTTTVRLQIGQRFASVGGKKVTLDTSPVILNGVTMVPLRFIADTLGAETRWEAATKTIIIIYPRAS